VNTTANEECDDGNNISGDGCDALCVIEFCGDGIVNNIIEECDDGNLVGGDGCEADCTVGFIACDITAATCLTGMSCYPTSAGDICLATGTVAEGLLCGTVNDCADGLGCVQVPTDPVNTYCRALCDVARGITCASGGACVNLNAPSNMAACLLDSCDLFNPSCLLGAGCYPTTAYGDVCWLAGPGIAGSTCTDYQDCEAGTTCFDETTPTVGSFCREICDPADPTACGGIATCVPGETNPAIGGCK
jgi:cysteine-rich repeat protein